MIGLKGLQDDINIAHSVNATQLQSNVSRPAVYNVLKPSIFTANKNLLKICLADLLIYLMHTV